ncbi:MAG: hypothetical protein LQ343_002664 [Gyalolechia ehrenbergii]|nr:MAG: hypothetical protein LQ343_002664 [Gyalolechia ehrenbergii]
MGSIEVALGVHPREDEPFQTRKRFKTSDLPLNATQRSTIDNLLHTIKKKGEYDILRKKVWSQFVDSVSRSWTTSPLYIRSGATNNSFMQDAKKGFSDRLNELADAEIDRDPSLLSRDRGKAATLMHGAVDRSDIYKSVELSLDQLISEHLNHVLAAGREIRKAEIGEEAAAEEERRGNIPDEEYAKDATTRREARERRKRQEEARKRREEEKEQLRAEAMKKEAELERLRRTDERRRERKAREERLEEDYRKRTDEEEERRKLYEQRKKEETEVEESSNRLKEEPASRHRSVEGVAPAGKGSSKSPHATEEDTTSSASAIPQIDEKAIEAAALEELLRESRELAVKLSSKPQAERSETLEPPYRKSQTLKPRSSNISPSKSIDLRQAVKSEPSKPILSFSATNVGRDTTTQRQPPAFQRPRSRSPSLPRHNHPDNRSRSPSRPHGGESCKQTHNSEDTYPKKPANSYRDPEADSYKDDVRETSRHSHSLVRDDTRERGTSRHHHGEDTYDRDDRQEYQYHRYDKNEHRSSGYTRSPSRRHQERDYDRHQERHRDRERDRERENDREREKPIEQERGHPREDRDRRYHRSRSPYKLADSRHHHHSEESWSTRSGQRTKSPVDIDRYVPGGGSYAKDAEREKYRHRDSNVDLKDDKHRHREREPDPRSERHRQREPDLKGERQRELDLKGERHRQRELDPTGDRHRDRDRGRDEKENARHRDRHDDRDRYRERYGERDRDRERTQDRELDKRHGHRRDDYDRGRERRDDGHDRERGRGYVEIDRYIPGGRDDTQRARGKDRSR